MNETILPIVHFGLIAIAAVLWVRVLIRGEVHRWLDSPVRVDPWQIDSSSFLVFLMLICASPLVSVAVTDWIFRYLTVEPLIIDEVLVRVFIQFLCWLAACLIYGLHGDQGSSRANIYFLIAFGRGVRGFLLFLPIFGLVAFGWEWILEQANLPTDQQDVVLMLRDIDDPVRHVLWAVQIVIVTPLVEELVFRAGLFRFLLARLPMKWAVILSSLVFGLIHMSWFGLLPLTLVGMVLALLYAKTGRLAAPVVLHAAINLNTMLVIWFSEPAF